MKPEEIFKKSFSVVNKAFIFVLIYYLLKLFLSANRIYKPHITISLFLLGLVLVIQCGIMGVISKLIVGEKINFKLFTESIKLLFLRYLGAFLILAILAIVCFIPSFIFFGITKGDITIDEFTRTGPSLLMTNLSMLLFTILSIYIFPFVFVRGKGADAPFYGIKYLFKNLKNSTPLIIMGIIKVVMPAFILIVVLKYPYHSLQYISLISISSFVSIYIELSIFAGACYILRSELNSVGLPPPT